MLALGFSFLLDPDNLDTELLTAERGVLFEVFILIDCSHLSWNMGHPAGRVVAIKASQNFTTAKTGSKAARECCSMFHTLGSLGDADMIDVFVIRDCRETRPMQEILLPIKRVAT